MPGPSDPPPPDLDPPIFGLRVGTSGAAAAVGAVTVSRGAGGVLPKARTRVVRAAWMSTRRSPR
ncbi:MULTISPECIES: hypothetical protein [unclassified Streptomyces]|uniref:hypothetical protein n=1 Tax=unclassified Streptomyces TaxID=2593676 RepID=UPI00093A09B3|nr:hypothetical protein [Streptomyces sp. CB01580]OKJ24184.1 hypothetical protein AMK22_34110 [Streptomyces sp. CB01580]